MPDRLPLSTLLSQVLVAFTIEVDNEFERQLPHVTSTTKRAGPASGPWLVSLPMWSNFLRFIGEQGVPLGELDGPARMTNLAGLERWRYIVVQPDPADSRPKPPRRDWIVRVTPNGRRAQDVWRPLPGVIEQRWRQRFGEVQIDELRASLQAVVGQLDVELPHYLPVVGYAMRVEIPDADKLAPPVGFADGTATLDLSALLSQVLLAFTLDFERDSNLSLAMGANALRVVTADGVRVRDLPRLAGVSKEAIAVSLGFLEKRGYLVVEPDPSASRTKLARLTPKGGQAQDATRRLLRSVEERWVTGFGSDGVRALRESLERLVGEPASESSLLRGLEPYADGWRASVPKPETLPHHPMVLHRGGFPDGS